MNPWLLGVILAICAVAAIILVVHLVRDVVVEDGMYVLLAVLEAALVVQAVWVGVELATGGRDLEVATLVGYVLTVLLAPVAGAFFSLAERSRVGTSILLLAVATVAAMQARIWQLGHA